jgi:hypothetical protein
MLGANDELELISSFRKHLGVFKSLPACASCGVRALPSDADGYKSIQLKFLDVLKYFQKLLYQASCGPENLYCSFRQAFRPLY